MSSSPISGRALSYACLLGVLAQAILLFTTPLRAHRNLLVYAQDDFYYYLVVAKNLASGVGSTFDGVTPTNGYHPLYELILWGIARVAPSLSGVYKWLALLDISSAVTIFVLVRRLLSKHLTNLWLINAVALLTLYICCFRIVQQMEVTLTLPFALGFLLLLDAAPETLSVVRWFWIGLVAAGLTLTRLDSGILVALAGGGALMSASFRKSLNLSKVAMFLLAALPPIICYFAINERFFGGLMPVSGVAKQLKTTVGFSWASLPRSLSVETSIMFGIATIGLVLLFVMWHRLTLPLRLIAGAALFFPFVHWLSFLWLSDWRMWGWYNYSLCPAVLVFFILFAMQASRLLPHRVFAMGSVVALICAAGLFLSVRYRVNLAIIDIAQATEQLDAFAATHPGRYTMGDRAGMVGYSLGQPLLQTEGLMMDRTFLQHIRQRDSLKPVLRQYGVKYYVAFDSGKPSSHPVRKPECLDVREPSQAGPNSPVMKDEFCQSPEAVITTNMGKTVIYKLNDNAGTSSDARRNGAQNAD